MAEQTSSPGKDLNATFLPASLLRKNENKLATTLTAKYQFQKTTGNDFLTIDPPQIKFAGYQLDKSYTATFKIINRAPIPQRFTVIPPESEAFAIKNNKKGSIASGMAETITVVFRSNEYKYQTDMVCLRTETQNFVVPLYAFPTLPDLRSIFPKVIDFGTVQCKQPSTYHYPIKNDVPRDFQFEFVYQKESQEISINPIKGVIPAEGTLTVEITFMPTAKFTSTAELELCIQQFDFKPLPIKIIGTGMHTLARPQPKRIKSSKLAPLKEGQEIKERKNTPQPLLKRKPSGELGENTNQFFGTKTITAGQTGAVMKKVNIRTSYPKLMSTRRPQHQQQQETKALNPAQIAERDYLNRFSRIQGLDKEKDIKFAQFLGDKAMTEEDIQFQQQLAAEIVKVRMQALERKCRERINPELSSDVAVEFKVAPPKTVTWDDKQNDEHHNRRKALTRFMNAGTKVIVQYRLAKRLGKIKQLLINCTSKEDVRKLVEQSHSKAIDKQYGQLKLVINDDIQEDFTLNFGRDSIHPSFFELQFEANKEQQAKVVFKPEGKTSFDDFAEIKELLPHSVDKFKFTEAVYPADFYNHKAQIPPPRQSGQEQYFLKTSALGEYTPQELTSVYSLPIKVPAHHFIYDNQKIKLYQNYISADQKDPEIYLQNDLPIEDEFEGWTGGQFQIIKYKFTRNLGCPYITTSGYNFSSERNPLPPLSSLGQDLPTIIPEPTFEDTIEQGDSDEQNLNEDPVQPTSKFLDQIEASNADIKQRRSKKQIRNPERATIQQIQKSLGNLKAQALGEFVGRIKESNKWVEHNQNRLLL